MKRKITAAAAFVMLMGLCASASAAYDENLKDYTLDTVVISSDRLQDQFGNTVTEQSYYRTGGDVKVITREEIEKRHYNDISEAIKRIPGVSFTNPGYRGGEYGFSSAYNNGVVINGDTRVIILIDGRRVDNSATSRLSSSSTSGGKGTGVILDQVCSMDNIDKIEVIKGPGASVYGPDAIGGVINIITRKGASDNKGSIDLSTGSWKRHKYAINYSGSALKDNSLHYFLSASRYMGDESKYKYGPTGQTGRLPGSNFKEESVNLRVDKEFGDKQNLKIWYNHNNGMDGYPVTAPNPSLWNKSDWQKILFAYVVGPLDENNAATKKNTLSGEANIPGYRTIYNARALVNCANNFQQNDLDVTYTFNKENGMDSFLRVYRQAHRYWYTGKQAFSSYGSGGGAAYAAYTAKFPSGATNEELQAWMDENLAPFPGGSMSEQAKEWIAKYCTTGISSMKDEKNRGIQLQYAKAVGVNDIIASVTYDKAEQIAQNYNNGTSTKMERNSILAYVQDKVHVSDKFDITPSLRFSKYSGYEKTAADGVTTNTGGSNHSFTGAVNAQYMFDDSASAYVGATKLHRPIRPGDYTLASGKYLTPLQDEKGMAYTFGVRKELGDKTSVAVHYDLTNMSNSIATLPIWEDEEYKRTAVNAKETKKSFNITAEHKFNENFTMSASYSHTKNTFKAKDGWVLDPSWGYNNPDDLNTAINSIVPKNHYALNMSYEKGKLYTGLLTNLYTGCNTNYFSSNHFLILDWNLNYKFNKAVSAYVVVNNLTNEAYETIYYSRNGVGAASMPGRSFMVGVRYNF